jgi:hypothetical protein|nr:MAG TPA: AntA/AntB antirepressor [Bacteriophage sp.]
MSDETSCKTPAQQAKARYEQKRVIKPVSFNVEQDAELLKKADSIKDFSRWVKDRLRET